MSQPNNFNVADTDGITFLAKINELLEAIRSSHSGTARPPYAVKGTVWHNQTDNSINIFDGTKDANIKDIKEPLTASSKSSFPVSGFPGTVRKGLSITVPHDSPCLIFYDVLYVTTTEFRSYLTSNMQSGGSVTLSPQTRDLAGTGAVTGYAAYTPPDANYKISLMVGGNGHVYNRSLTILPVKT